MLGQSGLDDGKSVWRWKDRHLLRIANMATPVKDDRNRHYLNLQREMRQRVLVGRRKFAALVQSVGEFICGNKSSLDLHVLPPWSQRDLATLILRRVERRVWSRGEIIRLLASAGIEENPGPPMKKAKRAGCSSSPGEIFYSEWKTAMNQAGFSEWWSHTDLARTLDGFISTFQYLNIHPCDGKIVKEISKSGKPKFAFYPTSSKGCQNERIGEASSSDEGSFTGGSECTHHSEEELDLGPDPDASCSSSSSCPKPSPAPAQAVPVSSPGFTDRPMESPVAASVLPPHGLSPGRTPTSEEGTEVLFPKSRPPLVPREETLVPENKPSQRKILAIPCPHLGQDVDLEDLERHGVFVPLSTERQDLTRRAEIAACLIGNPRRHLKPIVHRKAVIKKARKLVKKSSSSSSTNSGSSSSDDSDRPQKRPGNPKNKGPVEEDKDYSFDPHRPIRDGFRVNTEQFKKCGIAATIQREVVYGQRSINNEPARSDEKRVHIQRITIYDTLLGHFSLPVQRFGLGARKSWIVDLSLVLPRCMLLWSLYRAACSMYGFFGAIEPFIIMAGDWYAMVLTCALLAVHGYSILYGCVARNPKSILTFAYPMVLGALRLVRYTYLFSGAYRTMVVEERYQDALWHELHWVLVSLIIIILRLVRRRIRCGVLEIWPYCPSLGASMLMECGFEPESLEKRGEMIAARFFAPLNVPETYALQVKEGTKAAVSFMMANPGVFQLPGPPAHGLGLLKMAFRLMLSVYMHMVQEWASVPHRIRRSCRNWPMLNQRPIYRDLAVLCIVVCHMGISLLFILRAVIVMILKLSLLLSLNALAPTYQSRRLNSQRGSVLLSKIG